MDAQLAARQREECETDRLIHISFTNASIRGGDFLTNFHRQLVLHGMTVTPIRSNQ